MRKPRGTRLALRRSTCCPPYLREMAVRCVRSRLLPDAWHGPKGQPTSCQASICVLCLPRRSPLRLSQRRVARCLPIEAARQLGARQMHHRSFESEHSTMRSAPFIPINLSAFTLRMKQPNVLQGRNIASMRAMQTCKPSAVRTRPGRLGEIPSKFRRPDAALDAARSWAA